MRARDIRDALISPNATVRVALEAIDRGGMGIALVVDDAHKLLGTISDGDVRRGILRGVGLDQPAETLIHRDPVVATVDTPEAAIGALMAGTVLRQIPIVDREGRVVSIMLADDLLAEPMRDNLVVIMAGGLGTRLRPLTDHVPKPLLKVGSRPILETIILQLARYGFHNICLSVNYKSELIQEYCKDGSQWGVNIKYLPEKERMGTAGSLQYLPRDQVNSPFLVMNGDLLTNVNFGQLLAFHTREGSLVTMAVQQLGTQVRYGVVDVRGTKVAALREKPCLQYFINAGIYVLDPGMLDLIPDGMPFNMTELIQKALNANYSVGSFPVWEFWLDIGQPEDYQRANQEYNLHFGQVSCGVRRQARRPD